MASSSIGSRSAKGAERRRSGVVVIQALSVFAFVWNGACATPPEAALLSGLPCDNGACAPGFDCDTATGTCVAPGAPAGSGGDQGGGGNGSGGASVEAGGSNEPGGGAGSASGGSGGLAAGGGGAVGAGAGGVAVGGRGGFAGAPDAGFGDAGVSCNDARRNGTETDVDCGGPTCAACPTDGACAIGLDCASRRCASGSGAGSLTCLAPTCSDGVVNGAETGVDCGGACHTCGDGARCKVASDCTSKHCFAGVCVPQTCLDTRQNATETDVDCGGPSCSPCARGLHCSAGADCITGVCRSTACAPPSCVDGVKNGFESDRDCGGPGGCARCVAGKLCTQGPDCESGTCGRVYSLLVCAP